MRLTEEEYAAFLHKQAIGSYSALEPPAKRSKYGNKKVVIDNITFDSKKEGERYRQLKMLERAGKVSNLVLQPSFELVPAVTLDGKVKRALVYVADFAYMEADDHIVEDVKGMKTDVYIIKKHLMKAVHNISIRET